MKNWMIVLFVIVISFGNFACAKDKTTKVKVVEVVKVKVPGETVFVEVETFMDELFIKLSEKGNTVASVIFSEKALPVLEISLRNFNFNTIISVPSLTITVKAVNSGELKDGDITAAIMDGDIKIASAILKSGRLDFSFGLAPVILPKEQRDLVIVAKRTNGLLVKKFFRFGIVNASDVDANNSVIEGLPIWGPVMNTERGEIIFSREGKITTKNLKTGEEDNLSYLNPTFIFDTEPFVRLGGRMIAFISSDPNCQQRGVFIMYTNGTGRRRITGNNNDVCKTSITDSEPNISPDGSSIVFTRTVFDMVTFTSHSNILLVNVKSSEVRYLTTDLVFDRSPVFSYVGDKIYFASTRLGNFSLYYISINGGVISTFTLADGKIKFTPAVNPINDKLVFVKLEFVEKDGIFSTSQNVATINPDGIGRKQITHEEANIFYENPSWGSNGRIIVKRLEFFPNGSSDSNILIMESNGSSPRKISVLKKIFGKVSFSR